MIADARARDWTARTFRRWKCLSDVLSSQRFDLYGLVPQGKALDAEFSLDPLPQAGLPMRASSFPAGDDPKALEAAVRAHPDEGRAATACRRSWSRPPRSRSAARRSSRRTRSASWPRSGPTRWRCTACIRPTRIWRASRKSRVADVNRVARKYLDLDHAIIGGDGAARLGQPVAVRGGGFGGQETSRWAKRKPTTAAGLGGMRRWTRLAVPPSTLHPVVSTLPNGLTLIVQTEDVSDTVSVFGHIRNRPETEEPQGSEGISQCSTSCSPTAARSSTGSPSSSALDDIGAAERAGTDFAVADAGARISIAASSCWPTTSCIRRCRRPAMEHHSRAGGAGRRSAQPAAPAF